MKKDLTNIRALLTALGNPEKQLKVVHIGGTNGKGSTAHLIAAALQATGARVGVYTSPHYKDFRERIKINANFVSEAFVVDFIDAISLVAATIKPSFFELTVAMAFDYFAKEAVDWAVVEVGLGGRLDSTNVVDPVLSIITNISLDHTQFLGDTLPEIATEKAGIIKPGCPVIIGEDHPATRNVFLAKAREVGAPIIFADQWWRCEKDQESITHTHYRTAFRSQLALPNLAINMHGPFQGANVQTALAALHELQYLGHLALHYDQLREAWSNLQQTTYYIGRWQILGEKPLVIADSAHNEGGLQLVLSRLTSFPAKQLHIVLGVVKDKTLAKVLPLFPADATYYFVHADIPRALPAASLAQTAAQYGLAGQVYSSVAAGYEMAKATASKEDLIFVGGSIFTVAEIL